MIWHTTMVAQHFGSKVTRGSKDFGLWMADEGHCRHDIQTK